MRKLQVILLIAMAILAIFTVSCSAEEVAAGNYDQTDAAVTVASNDQENDSFPEEPDGGWEVDGDPEDEGVVEGELSGKWGKHMYGLADGASNSGHTINHMYSELEFDPIGSRVTQSWVTDGVRYEVFGYYRVEKSNGTKKVLWTLQQFYEPSYDYSGPELKMLGTHVGYLVEEPGQYREIRKENYPEVFVEDIVWDYDRQHYIDAKTGMDPHSPNETRKDPIYGLFPHESGDFTIRAELTNDRKAVKKLIIVPFFHFASRDEKKLWEGERDLAVAAAKKWLKQEGVPSSIPIEIRIED